jgi:hypothetical protein
MEMIFIKGSLKSLTLRERTQLYTPGMLQDWAKHIDFTRLRHLALGGCLDLVPSGLSGETMKWIAQTQSFSRVK